MDFLEIWANALPNLLGGLKWTLLITVLAIAIGYPLGLVWALGVRNSNKIIRGICLTIVEIGRGAPALAILYLFYYGLPTFGISFTAIVAAVIGLAWNSSAYASEMIRGGIQSVPKGQLEAAEALGLKPAGRFWKIIFPQGMRSATPGLMGLAIQTFQGTSLAYAITVDEMVKVAYNEGSRNFEYLPTFALAGVIYAVIAIPATWITSYFERRMARKF
ncbi:MAG: amino acid ABC transporter permease [Galactobacter sp.]